MILNKNPSYCLDVEEIAETLQTKESYINSACVKGIGVNAHYIQIFLKKTAFLRPANKLK